MPTMRNSLGKNLLRLGVQQGDVVMVQASVRSVAPVTGGVNEIILAMLDTVGPAGTLIAYVILSPSSQIPTNSKSLYSTSELRTLHATTASSTKQCALSQALCAAIIPTLALWQSAHVRSGSPLTILFNTNTAMALRSPRLLRPVDGS